jgi:hypothetical protein
MNDYSKLQELAEKATPGRIHDRLDSAGGGLKYECRGDDGSLVLKVDHKNYEFGFIGDRCDADEAFFLACTPAVVLELIAENKGYAKKIKWDESWYGTRFETLFHWAHRELNEEQKTQYFNIVANGSSSPLDPPTYAQQMNSLKWKVEAAEKERDMLKAEVERLRTAEGDAMTYKAGMENVAQQRDQIKTERDQLFGNSEHLKVEAKENEMHMRAFGEVMKSQAGQIEQLKAELETLAGLYNMHRETETREMRGLKAEIKSLRKNAERYQHLRKAGVVLEGHDFISYDEIADYRIDVAMGKEGK